MNNRYLCKAKRLDNGEWVEGYLAEQDYPDYHAYIIRSINIEMDEKHIDILQHEIYEVNPETICQYTGYPNIWEKDIFQFDEERYVICFCEQSLAWEAASIFSSESISLGEFQPDEIDVIGNEIDNPELLESEE